MRYFYLLQILCFNFVMAFGHNVTLTDSITNAPIFSATVCDADGNYVGRSDVNGNVKLEKGCAYYVSHICYESKKFIYDGSDTVVISPKSYSIPDIVITAKMKKYYHCKVFFRNVVYADSCMKYYIDGVMEFFINTKTRKVKPGNVACRAFQTTQENLKQHRSRVVTISIAPGVAGMWRYSLYEDILKDKRKRIEEDIVYGDTISIGKYEVYPDKNEIVLSCDLLYPKSYRKVNLLGYNYMRTEDIKTEVYDAETAPSIFDLKSFNRYSHDKFSLKNDFDWDVVTEKMFFVVEREYTDTMEFTPSDLMEQDYDRYSEIYPADEKTKNQLAKMEHVYHFTE